MNTQTKPKYTPGPWIIQDDIIRANSVVAKCEKIKIISLASSVPLTNREVIANARLISAAPDIKEALIDLCVFLRNYPHQFSTDIEDFLIAGEQAIAKAEGN